MKGCAEDGGFATLAGDVGRLFVLPACMLDFADLGVEVQEMTIDEAINHCKEVAKSKCDCCGAEHKQLAEWLIELKGRRTTLQSICDSLRHEFYGYDSETDYYAGYDDGIKRAMTMIESERGEDGRK